MDEGRKACLWGESARARTAGNWKRHQVETDQSLEERLELEGDQKLLPKTVGECLGSTIRRLPHSTIQTDPDFARIEKHNYNIESEYPSDRLLAQQPSLEGRRDA